MMWEQRVPTIVVLTRIFEERVREICKIMWIVNVMWSKL